MVSADWLGCTTRLNCVGQLSIFKSWRARFEMVGLVAQPH